MSLEEASLDILLAEHAQDARIERAKIIRDHAFASPAERDQFICSELQQLMCECSLGYITHRQREQLAAVLRCPQQRKKQSRNRTRKR
jgi:hypothetical protein